MSRCPSPLQRYLASHRRGMALILLFLTVWWIWDWYQRPDLVTRVLFCETANCTPQERLLVAGVIRNRVGRPAFGTPASLREVVEQSGAFSCIDDDDNYNWAKTRHPASLTATEQAIWRECLALAQGHIQSVYGPSGRPLIYYHDRSITKPRSWDNQTWHAVLERTTIHFAFYSIVPVKN